MTKILQLPTLLTKILQLPTLPIARIEAVRLDKAVNLFENGGWKRIGSEPVEISPGIQHLALVCTRSLPLEKVS